MSILIAAILALYAQGFAIPPIQVMDASAFPGMYGLACDPAFRSIPGNAQSHCPEGFTGALIFTSALRDQRTAEHTILHESYHLRHTDGLHEEEAYAYACGLLPVDDICARFAQ